MIITCDCFVQEAITIYKTYRPGYTEVSGLRDLERGVTGLAYSSLWRLRDSNDLGTGTPIATQAMHLSGFTIAQGLMKLTIPIIISTGYLVSRSSF